MFSFSRRGAACSVAVPFILSIIASSQAAADTETAANTETTANSETAADTGMTADMSSLPAIVVSAQHLDEGRSHIQTQTGASTYTIDSVLAYSAVCGTGLDTVPYSGDISEEQLEKIMGDVASLAWKWHKPLSARLQPVKGKRAGEQTEFHSQYLFNTTLQPLSR